MNQQNNLNFEGEITTFSYSGPMNLMEITDLI